MRCLFLVLFAMMLTLNAKASFFVPNGSITDAKLAPKVITAAAQSSSYNVTSSYANVPGLSLVIPGDNRPRLITLSSKTIPSVTPCEYNLTSAGTSSSINYQLYVASVLMDGFVSANASETRSGTINIPYLANAPSSPITVVVRARTFGSPTTAILQNCELKAIPL